MNETTMPEERLNKALRIFGMTYFAIMALVLAYLWLVSEDQFRSESMFKVTTEAGTSDMTDLAGSQGASAVAAAGLAGAQTANGYITSGDLLLQLEKEFDLFKHYTAPPYDIVFRLRKDATIEQRVEYYRNHISSHYDLLEGVTIVTVDTFSAELSQKINKRILELTETFVNGINRKISNEQITFYKKELERTNQNVSAINQKILDLQNAHNLIAPEDEVAANLKVINDMTAKKVVMEGEIATITRSSPDSPRIDLLKGELKTLNESIDAERSKLSGTDQKRMNQLLMDHQVLRQRLEFALQMRNTAEMTLEKIRMLGLNHSRFFILFQEPFKPEKVGYPRRPYATVTIVILGTLIFLILRALAFTFFERA